MIFGLFKRKKKTKQASKDLPVIGAKGEMEDPFLAAMINEAYRTGKPVVGKRNEDGKEEYRVVESGEF